MLHFQINQPGVNKKYKLLRPNWSHSYLFSNAKDELYFCKYASKDTREE